MKKSFLPPVSDQVSRSRYCYLATTINPSAELRVMCAGKEWCDPDFRVAREDFPCFGLELIFSGAGHLVLNGHSQPLHAGIMFCYGPGISHQIVNQPGHRMTKYFVDFWGDEAAALLRQGRCRPGEATQVAEVELLRELFEQLVTEGARKSASAVALCAAYLRVILLKAAAGVKPAGHTDASLFARFQRWRDFIEANYHRVHNLEDLAAALAIRPTYLCRVFKRFGQPSPFRYLTRMKMNRAADLLAGARLSVKAAALEAGYADPYHFSRLFKDHFGCSPSRFVEQHWRLHDGANPGGLTAVSSGAGSTIRH